MSPKGLLSALTGWKLSALCGGPPRPTTTSALQYLCGKAPSDSPTCCHSHLAHLERNKHLEPRQPGSLHRRADGISNSRSCKIAEGQSTNWIQFSSIYGDATGGAARPALTLSSFIRRRRLFVRPNHLLSLSPKTGHRQSRRKSNRIRGKRPPLPPPNAPAPSPLGS